MGANILLLHLEEGSAAIADTSPSALSGTYNGSLFAQSEIQSLALGFDGANDRIDFGMPTALQSLGAGTVTFWFQPSTLIDSNFGTTTDLINRNAVGNNAEDFIVHILGGTGLLRIDIRNSANNNFLVSSDSTSWAADVWHHVAASWDQSTGRIDLYINGSLQSMSGDLSYTGTTLRPGELFTVGANATGGSPFPGLIDELAVFNRALTAEEIGTIYNVQRPGNACL